MNFASGSSSNGYGPVGEAFGKGVGDYINQTMVQAQKNKYMQENDPIEIEKRAERFYGIYNNMPSQEQDKVDKWLNETPEGLKWLDRLNKHAGHLMTKVPLPKDYVAKPGEAPDDITWYRPLRTIQTKEQQQNALTPTLPPDQRENILFADQIAKLKEAKLREAQAINEPTTGAAQKLGAEAQMLNAQANQSQAAAANEMLPLQKETERAKLAAEKARLEAMKARAAKDPAGVKLIIEQNKARQAALKIAGENFRETEKSLQKLYSGDAQTKKNWENKAGYAEAIAAYDPLNPQAINLYAGTMQDISSKSDQSNAAENYRMGLNVLNSWEANVNTYKSFKALWEAKNKFLQKYWQYKYPDMSMPNVEKAIRAEMERMRGKEKDVALDEARHVRREKELQALQLVVPQNDLSSILGVQ